MDSESTVHAVIYPLEKHLIQQILKKEKLVFGKYLTHSNGKTKIVPGLKILFYESKHNKHIVGEATIVDVGFYDREEIVSKFGDRFFLSVDELIQYSNKYPGREKKELIVMELRDPIIFNSPIRWKQPMTMVGLYITKKQYLDLFKN